MQSLPYPKYCIDLFDTRMDSFQNVVLSAWLRVEVARGRTLAIPFSYEDYHKDVARIPELIAQSRAVIKSGQIPFKVEQPPDPTAIEWVYPEGFALG